MKNPKRKRESRSAAAPAKEQAASAAVEAAPVAEPMPDATPAPAAEPSARIVALPANCTVRDAAQLKVDLCQAADQPAVALDGRDVERIDTAALQLLCAFANARAACNLKVEWLGASANVEEAARLLGTAALLCLPSGDEPTGVAA